MGDVLTKAETARIRALVLYEGSGERWDVEELADSHEELRARLDRAEDALREAEGRCVVWNVRASLIGPGSIGGYRCALCSARGPLPDVTHTSDCPFAALGAAGERHPLADVLGSVGGDAWDEARGHMRAASARESDDG